MTQAKAQRIVLVSLSLLALLGFWAATLPVILMTLDGEQVKLSDAHVYWIGTLSGLVGGYFASAFNVKAEERTGGAAAAARKKKSWVIRSLVGATQGMTRLVAAVYDPAGVWLGVLYLISYALIGVGAIVAIVVHGDTAPETLKSLAGVSGGLLIAAVRGSLGPR